MSPMVRRRGVVIKIGVVDSFFPTFISLHHSLDVLEVYLGRFHGGVVSYLLKHAHQLLRNDISMTYRF